MSRSLQMWKLINPYTFKLIVLIFVNLFSVIFSILSFFLIEPFVQLLFHGSVEKVSVLSQFFIDLISPFINFSDTSVSLIVLITLIVLFFLLKNLFLILSYMIMSPIKSDVLRQLRNKMYFKVLLLPISYFTTERRGDVVSRAVNDTQELEFTVLKSIQQLLTEPLTILIYLFSLFYISYQLTFFALLLLPLAGFLISLVSRSLRKKSVEQKRRFGELFSHLEETISGLRMIKGLNAQSQCEQIFAKYNNSFTDMQKRIYRRVDLASPMSEFLGVTVVMILLFYGGIHVLSGQADLSAGLFIVYIALFTQILNPAKNTATAISNYQRGLAALDRINEVLHADELIHEVKDPIDISKFQSNIIYNDVSFAYRAEPVLSHISFKVKKGEVCAFVGSSGSGKSTLVDLLPRFYDVTSGNISIDGVDIRNMRIESLRTMFSIVSQDIVLFNDTILNNIKYGSTSYTFEDVVRASKLANAFDFIDALPQKFDTEVGDRGLCLSGGQRQRISMARALLRQSPILIFDEATSALDTQSEQLVQSAINEVMRDKTVFIIAHRLSTIYSADHIILLDGGMILEEGTHQVLMERCGKYSQLVNLENLYRHG